MAFSANPEKLEELISKAFLEPEIVAGTEGAGAFNCAPIIFVTDARS